MHNLLIIYTVTGWAYHFRAQALQKYAPSDMSIRIVEFSRSAYRPDELSSRLDHVLGDHPPDLVFVLCDRQISHIRRALDQRGWPSRLLLSWNLGWPNEETVYRALFDYADHILVNNRDYWIRSGMPARSSTISNGVDGDIFRVTRPIATRPPRLLWCGSQMHRGIKGYDRLVVPLAERLRAEGIDCDLLLVDSTGTEKRPPRQMADWYNQGSVLLCASDTEGTPNTALEAAACGCTVVSTPVGDMLELVRDDHNGYLVQPELEALYQAVRKALDQAPRLAAQMQLDIQDWFWATRSDRYYALFRSLLAVPAAGLRKPPAQDLRSCEKDFNTYADMPGLSEARAFVDACKAMGTCAAVPRLDPTDD